MLSRLQIRTAVLMAAALALASAGGCGRAAAPARSGTVPPLVALSGPAFGLTEDNANLLWTPDGQPRPGGARFQTARRELTALHPSYLRLLVDWAALQPDPGRPPQLEAPVSGCARRIGPCGAYAGIRDELAAIATQQRAAGTRADADFQVVIDIFSTPVWAARALSGCQSSGATPFSQAPTHAAIAAYRTLVRSLLALAARKGVALEWWSPWNEPNDPVFISPQRASCAANSPPVSPALYTELARAMAAELRADGGEHHLLLGELNASQTDLPDRTSVSQFVAALPADLVCLSDVWSIHVYASRGPATPRVDPVEALEAALNARGACGRSARIWVTEAGAGAPHPGVPRPAGAADEEAGCRAMAGQLIRWYRDPRVGAVFQYTFREDPAFPVGLLGAELSHVYPTYRLWLAWSGRRPAGGPPPSPAVGCG